MTKVGLDDGTSVLLPNVPPVPTPFALQVTCVFFSAADAAVNSVALKAAPTDARRLHTPESFDVRGLQRYLQSFAPYARTFARTFARTVYRSVTPTQASS